jgi:uncharacterized membrane protein
MFWNRQRLERFLDFDRVKSAIEAAEKKTSGEIRVSIAPFFWGSVERAAARAFARLGMTRTRNHNGVLLFIVPSRHAFAVHGDVAIHDRVPQSYWSALVAMIEPYFVRGEFTDGVIAGVEAIGEELSRFFPFDPGSDGDELPNTVDVALRP